MTIGKFAQQAGVNVQTIRYYERIGLLPATHRWPGSGYRDFDAAAGLRLHFILSAKEFGFTLSEIKELIELQMLPGESCAEVKRLLEGKRAELAQRMAEMKRLCRTLDQLITDCRKRRKGSNCPALWAIQVNAK